MKTFLEASHRVLPGQGHAGGAVGPPAGAGRPCSWMISAPKLKLPRRRAGDSTHGRFWPFIPAAGRPRRTGPEPLGRHSTGDECLRFPQWQLALITGEAELERGNDRSHAQRLAGPDFLHRDHLPLPELGSRLSSASAFLGHDSGIGHLAAAVGLPALLLFGPTDLGPLGSLGIPVRGFCSPRNGRFGGSGHRAGMGGIGRAFGFSDAPWQKTHS